MHHIQRKILNALLYAVTLPYAAMRPAGVESNHYAYHLDKLLSAGLIEKCGKAYTLTAEGLALVDRLSHENMAARMQPHISTMIDITNDAGQTLLFKRSFQPYIHRLGLPLGKTHYEEGIAVAAARELYEKTGLQNIPLTQRGIVYIEGKQDGKTISKILCHVFQGVTTGAPAVAPVGSHRGECMWMDHTSLAKSEVMPSFFAIKKLLAGSREELFFTEITEEVRDS